MNAVEFIQNSVQGLHWSLMEDMKDLSQEHLGWRPQSGANPISHIFIHYMRTEDILIHRMQGMPSLWDTEKWHLKFGVAFTDRCFPTGEDEADIAPSLPLAVTLAYAQRVMDNSREFLETLDDNKLDIAPDPNRPRRTIGVNFRAFILAHGWWHLGEIRYLKGLQGIPASV